MVPNALIRCSTLSLKAKGLYCLLFAKPDNWTYVEEALIKESADGREAFRSGITELVRSGWLTKVQVRDEKGVFSHVDWCLSEDGKPVDGLSAHGQPAAGQSPTNNTDGNNTDLNKTVTPKAPKGAEPVSGFDEFWEAYPRKVGKPNAFKAWKRLKPDLDAVLAALKRQKASEQWSKDDGQFIPHPTTWLNRAGWDDAVAGEKPVVSPEELEARRRKAEAGKSLYEESIRRGQEERMRQMGITA
ncbi:hypothetical protein CFBP5875_04565 [Agrobacterium pusense]|uniref:hypothetical protein n=1 Tax=Agrobacterium pusense TaxID=648995 RepID=UPI0010BF4ECC|nr:hypothetical protein [Agrobacterium pusense]QCL83891.1 hypothetical protein CFBP5875_04565 [Agrobacterium pusense]